MAVSTDFAYLSGLIRRGVIMGPVLEVGSRAWQGEEGNARATCEEDGIRWQGADISAGEGVDIVLDILDRTAVDALAQTWPTVLLMNLLEHLYDPIRAAENALSLVAPGGHLVIVGPVLWQLHDYPVDCWRPLPDFFVEFARRNGCDVVPGSMSWLVRDRILPIERMTKESQKKLPSISKPGVFEVWGRPKSYWSRLVHTALRTFGRDTLYPDTGLGLAIARRPQHEGGAP